MYYEREKRDFDLMSEVCALLHPLSLTLSYGLLAPGPVAGQEHCHRMAWYFVYEVLDCDRPRGWLVNCLLWVRIMTD